MNETVRQALMMIKAETQAPPENEPPVPQENANYALSNSHEVSSDILLFLEKLQAKVHALKNPKKVCRPKTNKDQ